MAGIGKYTKKSKGNRGYKMSGPSLLKMVADLKPSPITSPYKQGGSEKSEEELANQVNVTTTNADKVIKSLGKSASPARQEEEEGKGKKILKKVGNTLVGAFTSGLDAVYGSGKVLPGNTVKFSDPKKKKPEKKFGTTALDDDTTEDE